MTKIQIIVNDNESTVIEKEFVTEEDVLNAIEAIAAPVFFKGSSNKNKKHNSYYNTDELLKRFDEL